MYVLHYDNYSIKRHICLLFTMFLETANNPMTSTKRRPTIQALTGLDSVHGSTVNRKIERLPYDLLQNLSEDIFRKIDNHYTEKNPNTSPLGPLSIVDSIQVALPSKAGEWAYCSKDSNTIKIHTKLACINDKITFPKKVQQQSILIEGSDGVTVT
jgi:hypothetical protein